MTTPCPYPSALSVAPLARELTSPPTCSPTEPSVQVCNLHMRVPVEARRNAKLAAVASGIPFRQFVTMLLLAAKPLQLEAFASRCSSSSEAIPSSAIPVPTSARESARESVGNESNENGDTIHSISQS